jgi:hypothetical protein
MAHPTQLQLQIHHHLVPNISKNVGPPEREIAPAPPATGLFARPPSNLSDAALTDE